MLNNKETRTLENSNKHIDNWLSQQFEDFTPNPEPGLWQSIDSALDRKERRSKFIWYWLAAGVLLSVIGVAAIQWNLKHTPTLASHGTNQPLQEKTALQNATAAQQTENAEQPTNGLSELNVQPEATNVQGRSNRKASHKIAAVQTTIQTVESTQSPESIFLQSPTVDAAAKNFQQAWMQDLPSLSVIEVEKAQIGLWQKSRKPLTPGRWSIEVGADANQTGLMYKAKADYGNYIHKNYFDRMKSGEFALSAGRIQGALLYQLTRNHAIKLGLAYAENRTQQRFNFRDSMPATVIQGQKADALGYYPIFGYLGLGPQVTFESQSTYSMLSIPVGYTGHFPWKNGLSITPEVLLSANRLGMSSGAQTLDYQTLLQKSQHADELRTWVMGMRIAIGLEKRLNYANAIGLRFNAQSMVSPMYVPNAALQSRGWSAGLSAHYSWRIQ